MADAFRLLRMLIKSCHGCDSTGIVDMTDNRNQDGLKSIRLPPEGRRFGCWGKVCEKMFIGASGLF